jgi:hypothetical protein
MFSSTINSAEETIFFNKLEELDFSMVKKKVLINEPFSGELVDTIEKWYKRFLFLNYKYSNYSIVPNELIDLFWHNHILDTRKYQSDCVVLFGNFLHHFPYFGMRDEEDRKQLNLSYEQTKKMFFLEFGEIPFSDQMSGKIFHKTTVNDNFLQKAASCSDCSGAVGTGTE